MNRYPVGTIIQTKHYLFLNYSVRRACIMSTSYGSAKDKQPEWIGTWHGASYNGIDKEDVIVVPGEFGLGRR